MRSKRLIAGAFITAFLLVAPFYLARRGTPVSGNDEFAVPYTHDMSQHITVLGQVDRAVREGHLYPRWQQDFNRGYGTPWLHYYPPGFYLFAEPFLLIAGNPIDALLVACVVLMFASGIAMYALARLFSSVSASAVAAFFYMAAPYHTLDLYWRGALPELMGFVFVPLTLYCALRRHIPALAIVLGLFLLCHFPVSYLMTVTLVVYAGACAYLTRDWKVLRSIGMGAAWALLIGVTYWLVAWLDAHHVREPFSQAYEYHRSYLTLIPSSDRVTQYLQLSMLGLIAAVGVSFRVLRSEKPSTEVRVLKILAVGTTLMVTPWSASFANMIPEINRVSFAWRWLLIASCFAALVLAMALDRAATKASRRVLAAVVVANVAASVAMMPGPFFLYGNLHAPPDANATGFLPGRAPDPATLPDTPRALLSSGSGSVEVIRWSALRREIRVRGETVSALRLRTFHFRGWTARVDGRRARIRKDPVGAILIWLPAGTHHVVVTYENTRTTKIITAVSALALLAAFIAWAAKARTYSPLDAP